MSVWQPIETAPRDGTLVDLWVRPWDAEANGNPARIADSWYSDGEWMRLMAGWKHLVASCGEPTHWMPRPKPPIAFHTFTGNAPGVVGADNCQICGRWYDEPATDECRPPLPAPPVEGG